MYKITLYLIFIWKTNNKRFFSKKKKTYRGAKEVSGSFFSFSRMNVSNDMCFMNEDEITIDL